MKIIFWILVAVNVIFFAVMKSGILEDAQEPVPLPLHAEQISPLNALQPAQSAVAASPVSAPVSMPASAPIAAPASVPASLPASAPIAATANACFEWGEFSGAEINRVARALQKLQLGNSLSRHDVGHTWVYIPPLRDKAAVAQKVAQLKSLGVTDYFVVQDGGAWMNAISLGVFKTHEAAQSFLEGLRVKGIHSAKIGEKSGSKPAVMFAMSGLNREMSDKLSALQKDFSDIELKRVPCH